MTTRALLRSLFDRPKDDPDLVAANFHQGPAGDLEDHVAARLRDFQRSDKPASYDVARAGAEMADSSLPGDPLPLDTYLAGLFDRVAPQAVRTHAPRFIGHMTSALPAFVGPLARVVAALNQNVVKIETSNSFTQLERQALAMLHRLVYGRDEAFYGEHAQGPDSTLGMMVSGGTVGNITGLWCARNLRFPASGGFAGVEAEGLAAALAHHGYRRAVIVGSSLMHYSLRKAADVLGLGERNLIRVRATAQGQVDLARLRATLRRCRDDGDCVLALVGVAGTTETGGVDPLADLADLAAEHRLHFHVDAAWGGPVLFSGAHRGRLAGIERADSVVIDGHKQLYLPMGVGMLVLRDPAAARSIEKTANYIIRAGSHDLGRRSLEGSRPATALYLHAALHVVGRHGYEALIDHGVERSRFLAEAIRSSPEFELLAEPDLNIVNYRYLPVEYRAAAASGALTDTDNERINEFNRRLQEVQRDGGDGFVSRTTLENTLWGARVPIVSLRAVLANPLTTEDDLRAVLDEQVTIGRRLEVDEGTLHGLFEQQAARTPERVALVEPDGRTVTYRELSVRSNQLARLLGRRGVGGSVVGLCLRRSADLVVAMLGVWKAGAAYLPLDPSYPVKRLAFMLEDSRAPVVLTYAATAGTVPPGRATVVCLDGDRAAMDAESGEPLASDVVAADCAYLIYTSGSTGAPKGVMGTHRATLNRCRWMWEAFPFTGGEVSCIKTAASFVDSVWETVGPLLQGVPSVIVPQEVVAEPGRFVEALATHGVSRVVLVPSLLRTLLEVVPDLGRRLPRLAYWTSSGEALPADLARRFRSALPDATLLNLYGSSEVAADVTCYALGAADPVPEGVSVPIGKPIRNSQVHLLDEHRRPVAPGQEGELYIGGVQLSLGYLHRPDLTAERFVEDTLLGGRLYRTGDRARLLPDGNLEFVGRADHQVKVRGVRIEPGEIEAALRGQPDVSDAAVVAVPVGGDCQLVAYVAGRASSATELRRALGAKLPPHLVPARFVFLDALPLTPSGKVARGLLPPLERETAEPPLGAREGEVAAIWAEVLGCGSVGRGDDFFDLGGNSLSAAVLAARLSRMAGRDISPRFVYENSTLARCAASLTPETAGGPEAARGTLVEQMNRDAHLDPAIVPAAPAFPPDSPPESVFLTGATGFLGAFLLHEIAGAYRGPIDCLVRAPSVAAGRQRIREQLARFNIPAARIEARLRVVPGDLALPRFGLSDAGFEDLAGRVEVLFHCGAAVHFYHGYEHLQGGNVGGTREVIRLACVGRARPIHYVSTLAVVDTHASAGTHVTESWCPAPHDPPLTGYAQSKWVGERLLAQAGERGVPVAIYRCDDISGHSRSGAWNRTDFLWQWVRACAALGQAPDIDMPLYMIPVDAVSRAVVGIARHGARGETFHLRNPHPCTWRGLLDGLAACGHSLERIPFAAWRREVARRAGEGDEVFAGIAPVFTDRLPGGEGALLEYAFAGHRPTYDDANTARALAVAGVRLPPVDGPLIAVYSDGLRRAGFLPRPVVPWPSPAGIVGAGAGYGVAAI